MTQNPFQPWKQTFNTSNPNNSHFYRKNDCELLSSFNKMTKTTSSSSSDCGPSSTNLNILSHSFDLNGNNDGLQMYQQNNPPVLMTTSSSSNSVSDSDPPPTQHQHQQQQTHQSMSASQPKNSQQSSAAAAVATSSKFSIFSQLLNLNKIQSFDNLLINATLDDDDLSTDRRHGIRKLMEQAISDEAKQQIAFILEKISALRPAEKIFLYLKMPGGHSDVDPLKHSQNPLGSRSEITHTINWVRSHLEHDEKVSIPKQEVYEDYVSFCGKINIKPLSTADFGKVMKQVFPDIKPRRLGTRGHSRYCYAAMRKATKLPTPFLPDLSAASSSTEMSDFNESDDVDAWKTIKTWSESLLSEEFNTIDDLANHIKNNLNTTHNSTSKHALQKKILQRDFRDKKKNNNNQLLSLKKRRKKRRLSSGSTENTQEEMFNENIQIKQEKETDGSAVENNLSEDSSELPMNLTNSDQSHRIKNEIASTATSTSLMSQLEDDRDELRNKLNHKLASEMMNVEENFSHDTNSQHQQQHQQQQYMLCKKVRQAQQMKMSANQFAEGTTVANIVETTVNDMIMPSKIPAKRKTKKDGNSQIKKSKFHSAVDSESPLNHVEPNDLVMAKDDLKDDFILPRERFISICNMDKNALDPYLIPSEENSPDLEMMQYFGEDKSKNDSDDEDLGQATTSVPLLENYQLVNEGRNDNKQQLDKISQLRSMLEENQKSVNEMSLIKNLLQKNSIDLSSSNSDQMTLYGTSGSCFLAASRSITNANNLMQNGSDKLIPQSPNTRRKNFSFVPIPSHSTRVKNINLHPAFKEDITTSPFVSPRATSVNRRNNNSRSNQNDNNNMSISTDPKSIPQIGVNNTAFCRPHQFKIEPLSAPESPSMIQNFNYSPQANQQQQNHFQFQPLNNQQNSNFNYPVESRSQSVPPHCTNNSMFNGSNNNNNGYNGYSSACSSMAPTPVPSEFQEFSESNILDIFNNDQQSAATPSSIKLESNDDVIDLLDNEILNQNSDENQSNRQTFANSRSVPNTPLPFHTTSYNGNNSMNSYCMGNGKSVPTTPIAHNGTNPFRYSPELQRTRDFLINGFNNNNNNVINHNEKLIKEGNGDLTNEIDELSNLDANCFGTL